MNATKITFSRNGQTITGRILARDSDQSAAMWVVDARNPDSDYMVRPDEITGWYGEVFNRNGRAVTVYVPAN